jgi:uroporphyrinogen decarboxylase
VNSRQRVIRAIERRHPDRIPLTHATLYGAEARYGQALADLYRRYPSDVVHVGSATAGEFGEAIGVPSRDTWGSLWVRYSDEHKGQVMGGPLESWAALPDFEPPDTASDAILAAIEANLSANAGQRYTLADGDILWQRMFYLHGYQATLEDLLVAPDHCAALRDLILGVMLRRVERLCALPDLDGIHFRDDWGTQQSLMIRPELWRAFFKPAYARLFGLARDAGKHVWFHSDGAIGAILPDLIEIGVQVLNPQVDVVGRQQLSDLCRGRVCIEADIDRQWVLPYGSPEDVRAAVRADIAAFGGPEGGYIGRGEIAGDVPWANIVALFDEIRRHHSQRKKRLR